jgi:hypothetical protein
MVYTLDQIIARVATALKDTAYAVWATAEIGAGVADGLVEIASYKPYVTLATATPSAGTPDLDISGTAYNTLLNGRTEESFEAVEFKIDKDPMRFRNFKVHQNKITMDISFAPDGTDTARLYCRQAHILGGAGTSSLSPMMERILVELVASRLAVGIAIKYVNDIPMGGAQTVAHYITWGEHKLGMVINEMKSLVKPDITIRYPTVE